ncbi:MAG: hypothetical protein AAGA77_15215 [Bacteroidota bacterium]
MLSNIRINRICQFCNEEFIAKTAVTKYCGDPCAKSGFKLPKVEKKSKFQHVEDSKVKIGSYAPQVSNYVDEDTGEVMYSNKYLPSSQIEYIAKERIDKFKTQIEDSNNPSTQFVYEWIKISN